MVKTLMRHPESLAEPLGKDRLWIRGMEYKILDGDRVDLVVQDHSIVSVGSDTTCYAIEVKSGKGDHEILGQLKKAVNTLDKIGTAYRHWKHTVGISIAKKYTKSGLSLLLEEGMIPLLWHEDKESGQVRLTVARNL
jgi:RecB family endonuclease NucS